MQTNTLTTSAITIYNICILVPLFYRVYGNLINYSSLREKATVTRRIVRLTVDLSKLARVSQPVTC